MATALAYSASISPLSSEVSTTLTVGAAVAYEVFADAVEIPRWLPIVQTARVVSRTPEARPERVAFTRKLERGSLGYTLNYKYDPANLTITWATPATSNVILQGEARFIPLSMRACMMLYRLVLDLPIVDDMINSELDKHPASLVVSEFREHTHGAAETGFDFLSFTGTGNNARLFINEVKDVVGSVHADTFTTFGLGKSGNPTFDKALLNAEQAIRNAGLDRATTEALLRQLTPGPNGARIRLIGNEIKGTLFAPDILEIIGKKTGFITGEGFFVK